MSENAAASLSAAVEQASALLATDPAQAGRRAEAILKVAPKDPRAALILASARRRGGDARAARAILEPLARAYPTAAHTQYELGLTHAALGEPAAAIAALRRAVAARRELPEAWQALGDLLFRQGDAAGSEAAFAEQSRAAVRDPALRPAADALFDGRDFAAESLLRAHLAWFPNHVEGLRMLAEALIRLGRIEEAESVLAACIALDPDQDGARFLYADVLFRQQKGVQALAQVEVLFQRDPRDPAYRNLLAACLSLLGDYGRAIGVYEDLLAEYGLQPRIWLNYGHALRTTRRRDDAVAAYRRCIALAPGLGDAYWSLANLKVAPFSADETTAMSAQLRRADLSDDDRLHLHYALGKALEDRGDHAASFEHYAKGAAVRRSGLTYSADETSAWVRRSTALFTEAFFTARAGQGAASNAPIFIVGLPRSGSTLIEQILASHSAVEGTMELPDIGFIAQDLDREARRARGRYPEMIASLGAEELAALGARFLKGTQVHRKLGRPHFIDKMPNNFHHIGLIHLILPNARIVDARRHPMASCFSAFKQHFASGQAFSYDLTDLGRYYRDYVDLMAHFDAALPGLVHRVIYEDLVEDTEGQVRRLLDYCGLPFEASCLNFHQNERAVRTVSSEQVRRPIFRDGLDQWRRYEPWLTPLKDALGPALESWRD